MSSQTTNLSTFAADIPFKHRTLSRSTSIAIVQGHNIVNQHQFDLDRVAPSSSLADFVSNPDSLLEQSRVWRQTWEERLEKSSGTTDCEIEITQSHVLRRETNLLCMWCNETRSFSDQETKHSLVLAADRILALKKRRKFIVFGHNKKRMPLFAISSISSAKKRKLKKQEWKRREFLLEKSLFKKSCTLKKQVLVDIEQYRRRNLKTRDAYGDFGNLLLPKIAKKIDETCKNIMREQNEITMEKLYEKKLSVGNYNMYDSHHYMYRKVFFQTTISQKDFDLRNGNHTICLKEKFPAGVWRFVNTNQGCVPSPTNIESYKTLYLRKILGSLNDMNKSPRKRLELLIQALDCVHILGNRLHGVALRNLCNMRELIYERLLLYGYVRNIRFEESTIPLSNASALKGGSLILPMESIIVRSMLKLRFYFELHISPCNSTEWFIGFSMAKVYNDDSPESIFDGAFGLFSNGTCRYRQSQKKYASEQDIKRAKIIGCICDMLSGSLVYTIDGAGRVAVE